MKQGTLALPRVHSGGCKWPLWSDDERPKFRNGRPLLCSKVIDRGDYCCDHAKRCYVPKTARRAA